MNNNKNRDKRDENYQNKREDNKLKCHICGGLNHIPTVGPGYKKSSSILYVPNGQE
jgi:hypothetical protein